MGVDRDIQRGLGTLSQLGGYLLFLPAAAVGVYLRHLVPQRQELFSFSRLEALTVVGVAVVLGAIMVYVGRQLCAETAEEILKADKRPYILFLRSFRDDRNNALSLGALIGITTAFGQGQAFQRREEMLQTIFAKVGPLIAIGKPGERFPSLGAARKYLTRDDWQEEVLELARGALLVIIALGPSAGVWWEVDAILDLRPARPILFGLPRYYSPKRRRECYQQLRARLATLGIDGPPKMKWNEDFLYLNTERHVTFHRYRIALGEDSQLKRGLAPVLNDLQRLVADDARKQALPRQLLEWTAISSLAAVRLPWTVVGPMKPAENSFYCADMNWNQDGIRFGSPGQARAVTIQNPALRVRELLAAVRACNEHGTMFSVALELATSDDGHSETVVD
ncbi:MAG: transferase [Myxococcaceae bacterium]|nr:transferase [Myxococcaceae bacterium]